MATQRQTWTVGLLLLWAMACGGSPAEIAPAADASSGCTPGTRSSCACADRPGVSTCTAEGRQGGCECVAPAGDGGSDAPPVDPPDASCSAPQAWFRDTDGDGHGSGVPVQACDAPPGYVATDDDCDPADARVFPGQTAWFAEPRPNGSFDFDCDKAQTKKDTEAAEKRCTFVGTTCIGGGTGGYWQGDTVPECGATGTYILACSAACGVTAETRAQRCR